MPPLLFFRLRARLGNKKRTSLRAHSCEELDFRGRVVVPGLPENARGGPSQLRVLDLVLAQKVLFRAFGQQNRAAFAWDVSVFLDEGGHHGKLRGVEFAAADVLVRGFGQLLLLVLFLFAKEKGFAAGNQTLLEFAIHVLAVLWLLRARGGDLRDLLVRGLLLRLFVKVD